MNLTDAVVALFVAYWVVAPVLHYILTSVNSLRAWFVNRS